ncbi:hypothetical protein BH23PLA1_BH23PLA1_41020 [soil metagenome]
MSTGARVVLAVFVLICAACFAAIGMISGDLLAAGAWPFYGLAVFCVVIALACLSRSSRPVTLRLIGLVIFLAYGFYIYDSLGDLNILRAIAGLCVWGLPSGYLAIRGIYPTWGKGSAAFRTESNDQAFAENRPAVSSRNVESAKPRPTQPARPNSQKQF